MNKIEEKLSTWELFLGEITRNINPSKDLIQNQLLFLIEREACNRNKYEALVSVRFMAAYEQAINEYLHPPTDFKQANIKAELIHFGSLFEATLDVFLVSLFQKNKITTSLYNSWFPGNNSDLLIHEGCLAKKQKKDRAQNLTFNNSIKCLSEWNKHSNDDDPGFRDYARIMDSLRIERNNVHVSHMVNKDGLHHEEHKLVEVREKWDGFVDLVKSKV